MRVGVDIGGTFTDFLLYDESTGRAWAHKTLTTYPDPSAGVIKGLHAALRVAGRSPTSMSLVVHGTTLVTNTIIERTGSRTALLTTQGHRDLIELRREHRYAMYDVLLEFPEPLVPRDLRFDIHERISAEGEILEPLDETQVRHLIRRLVERGVGAIAVCLLHSYRNAVHELAIRRIVDEEAPGLRVSLSCEVAPEIKEFERASTTACNAYVQAQVDAYLGTLQHELRANGSSGSFFMMQSSGGLLAARTATRFPVRILESGPAGGTLAASYQAREAGLDRVLAFDMGGTTAKLSVVDRGTPLVTPGFEVARAYRFVRGSGLPVRIPAIDMMEIGAGGGSIAWLDPMGLIRIGPESARSDPGPACYLRGGTMPTVTDADLVLGYLDPDYFLGGRMHLSRERALEVIDAHIGAPLDLSSEAAAWGIYRIVNENMASAARVHLVERGRDAGRYVLHAFGGAGPVHASGVAEILNSPAVVVPFGAGVASALGFLVAPVSFEFVQGWYGPLASLDWSTASDGLEQMERDGVEMVKEAGVPRQRIVVHRTCAMRYVGQGFDVEVPVPRGRLAPSASDILRRRFEERYRRLYGRTVPAADAEVATWRVLVSGPAAAVHLVPQSTGGEIVPRARQAYFPDSGGFVSTPVYRRHLLPPAFLATGPLVIEEPESTTVVPPGMTARVDPLLNLILERGSKVNLSDA